jgi:hypothetical protein
MGAPLMVFFPVPLSQAARKLGPLADDFAAYIRARVRQAQDPAPLRTRMASLLAHTKVRPVTA